MIFDEPKLKPPTPNSKTKLEELCEQFKAARAESPKAFERLIRVTVAECKQAIVRDYSVTVPNYEVIICDNETFEKLLADELMYGGRPSSFINRAKEIIVINIGEKLTGYWGTFAVELVLDASEELVHAAFPLANEIETKKKSHEITEKFLRIGDVFGWGSF